MMGGVANKPAVLIAGAGPVGLMAACQLTYHGVPVIIIDKNSGTSPYSGALFIQARTLEIFDQLGLAGDLMKTGQIPSFIHVLKNGRHVFRARIDNMGKGLSKFPHVLMVKQGDTEKTMINYLHEHRVKIHWNTTLQNIPGNGEHVNASIKINGKEEILQTSYLIGADGANSMARKSLDITSETRIHPTPLFIFDGQASFGYRVQKRQIHFSRDTLYFSICRDRLSGFFPLPGNKWRIDGIIPSGIKKEDDFHFNQVKEEFDRKCCLTGGLVEADWFSNFRVQTKLVSRYKKNRCFLVGDAAHVHTPIGAQGMNTGIQDAYNLCWKMAFALHGKISNEVLETYEPERRPVAIKLIKSTDNLFLMVIKDSWFFKCMRNIIFPLFLKMLQPISRWQYLQRSFFKAISEIEIKYSAPRKEGQKRGWAIGSRIPYVFYRDETRMEKCLHDLVDGKKYVIVLLDKEGGFNMDLPADISSLNKKGILEKVKIPSFNKPVYKSAGIKRKGWYLVRPDLHVAEKMVR